MRMKHYLKANLRAESPQECIFFDTETNSELVADGKQILTLKFGQVVYTRKIKHGVWSQGDWYRFTDASDFWNFVISKTRPKVKLYIFAHNLVFDMTIVRGFTILPGRQWQLTRAIAEDPPTILTYTHEHNTICLMDTFNWFHSSLAELGEGIGMVKLEMPLPDASCEVWDAYNRRDVEIIKQAMIDYMAFGKINDLGNFQKTVASQAFSAYRHRFMHHEILIDTDQHALDLARSAYHGGRVDAFFIGEKTGDFYSLDVNSMYPFVMAVNEYPTKLAGFYKKPDSFEIDRLLLKYQVIADVELSTPEPCYPLQTKTMLLFPTGKFRTMLATPEFTDAWRQGRITAVHNIAFYEHAPLFESYIHEIYKLRMEYKISGNRTYELMCKMMLNSLYGKFGQRGRHYDDETTTDSTEIKNWVEYNGETGEVVKWRQFGGIIQSYSNEGESFNSHPAIAAHVTSYARMWLWKLITTAGIEHVFYCDTDSLVVDKHGCDILLRLFLGDDLGELKVEKQFSHLIIHGPKDYEFGDVKKIKGVRKNAIQLDINKYEQDSFSKFRGMVRRGDLDTMSITRESKTLQRRYTKGLVELTGRVIPFSLPGDEMYINPKRARRFPSGDGSALFHRDGGQQARLDDMRENFDRGETLETLALREKYRKK